MQQASKYIRDKKDGRKSWILRACELVSAMQIRSLIISDNFILVIRGRWMAVGFYLCEIKVVTNIHFGKSLKLLVPP